MKKFIKKTLAFVILPIIVGIPILLILVIYVNNISAEYQIKSNISSIYIGDSHIRQAIDDSIIPQSLNVASNSESFYFSYFKLKMLLNNNPSVEKVYLGFSYHSLSNYNDRWVCGDYSSKTAPKYFYLLPYKEQIRIIYWNKANLITFFKSTIKQGIGKAVKNDYNPFLGGFSNQFNNTRAVNKSMDKRLLFQYYNNGVDMNPFSEFNIQYLKKIISLCKAKGVELYTLNTPLNHYYSNKVPKEYKEKLNEIIYTNRLNYIDLSNLKLSDKCFIPDGDHVSNLGAEATSIELKDNARTQNILYK